MEHTPKTSQALNINFTRVKKPPYGFCTHLFLASTIILISGGLFLHMISRILKLKLKWIRVPTT